MKYKENLLLAVIFTVSLLTICHAYQTHLRKSGINLQKDKCFEFGLTKREKPLKNTLNLINLFSYHKALNNDEKSFISFHQLETSFISKKKVVIDSDTNNKTQNSTQKNISVYLENKYNSEYLGKISIGNKTEKFKVIFDTGSYDLIINSKLCLSATCSDSNQYKGTSHFPFMRQFVFGSGVIIGTLSKNDVYLGKSKINDVYFYEILAEDESIGSFDGMEGIVGLGIDDSSPTPNLFDYVVQQKGISNYFSVYLNREAESTKSKIVFGGIQEKYFKGSLKYYNVNDQFYWAIDMEAIIVGDKDTGICSKENKCKAVIDTGTSFFASSTSNIIKIASLIEVEGACDNFKELPDIKFVFDGDAYSIGPEEYLLTITEEGIEPVYHHSKNILQCIGAFSALDFEGMENYFILGDLFITRYYSVFDKGNRRIGFASIK